MIGGNPNPTLEQVYGGNILFMKNFSGVYGRNRFVIIIKNERKRHFGD
jgi:hypothetical protein